MKVFMSPDCSKVLTHYYWIQHHLQTNNFFQEFRIEWLIDCLLTSWDTLKEFIRWKKPLDCFILFEALSKCSICQKPFQQSPDECSILLRCAPNLTSARSIFHKFRIAQFFWHTQNHETSSSRSISRGSDCSILSAHQIQHLQKVILFHRDFWLLNSYTRVLTDATSNFTNPRLLNSFSNLVASPIFCHQIINQKNHHNLTPSSNSI
jgi:hypothetical protein